MHELNSGLNEL